MATAVRNRSTISLKGSAAIVSEYFHLAVNNILYQRGIYPEDTFKQKPYHGLQVHVSTDKELAKYLDTVMGQMAAWLESGTLQRVVMVVTNAATQEVVERWTFSVETDTAADGQQEKEPVHLRKELSGVMRQISSSVAFLPLLADLCTFDLLAYTSKDQDVPQDWEESDGKVNTNLVEQKLRSFSTKVHTVATSVAFKPDAAAEEDQKA